MFVLKSGDWYVMEIKGLAYTTKQKSARRYATMAIAMDAAKEFGIVCKAIQLLARA